MKWNIAQWNVTEETVVHENPYFSIVKQQLIQPDGKIKIYSFLKRPFPFSIVIPITKEHTTYLVKQFRIPTRHMSLEFPMGGSPNKTPLEIAQLELSEETGLTARVWKEIGSFYPACGVVDQKGHIFTAEDLRQEESHPESGEFLEVQQVPLDHIDRFIQDGVITDGPTITAYYFLRASLLAS